MAVCGICGDPITVQRDLNGGVSEAFQTCYKCKPAGGSVLVVSQDFGNIYLVLTREEADERLGTVSRGVVMKPFRDVLTLGFDLLTNDERREIEKAEEEIAELEDMIEDMKMSRIKHRKSGIAKVAAIRKGAEHG